MIVNLDSVPWSSGLRPKIDSQAYEHADLKKPEIEISHVLTEALAAMERRIAVTLYSTP